MSELRIKFTRGEEVKYISHLDMMKVFERALRRAGIPVKYSQGFNPHAHLVFGLPLSVGVTSQAEYADIELSEDIDTNYFITSLNKELPQGLEVNAAAVKNSKSNIMASIEASKYEILISSINSMEIEELNLKISALLNKPEIIVKKEGKKGTRDLDIKPMIRSINLKRMGGESNANDTDHYLKAYLDLQTDSALLPPSYNLKNIFVISALLSAGSVANLKPDLLFQAVNDLFDGSLRLIKVHRSGLYINLSGALTDPIEQGAL